MLNGHSKKRHFRQSTRMVEASEMVQAVVLEETAQGGQTAASTVTASI